MLAAILEVLSRTAKWSNANEGLLTLGIFLSTLFLGWVSGIFASLRNKPRFHLSLIEGPTFSRTFETGKKHAGFPVHRTGIALYLTVANIGSAPSSIRSISVGYHWHLRPFSMQWLSYRIGWFWLHDQVVALQDFQSAIGDNIKIYPFLIQSSAFSFASPETYLGVGKSTSGVVYFEQEDSWGGCFPTAEGQKIRIKVAVTDVFGHRHQSRFRIPCLSLSEARKFNPSFGKTHTELRQESLPFDATPEP
jgi:hypothetical protein